MELKVIQGGFKAGMWQSDRNAYSDGEIAAGNAIFEKLAQKHNPAWRKLIWDLRKPGLKLIKK